LHRLLRAIPLILMECGCILCVFFAGDGGRWERGEGMADEGGVDAAVAVEGFFEGEDDEHLRDALAHPAQATALPGPKLRTDEPKDGDAKATEVFGEAEVDVGEVDEDGERGRVALDGRDECAILRVDVQCVAEDLGESHVGDVLGADDALLAGGFHGGSAEAGKGSEGNAGAEFGDDFGAVVVAGGFAGGEKDARVGDGGDEDKFRRLSKAAQDVFAGDLLVYGDLAEDFAESPDL